MKEKTPVLKGFGLRLTFTILLFLVFVAFAIAVIVISQLSPNNDQVNLLQTFVRYLPSIIICIIILVATIICLIYSKKKKEANIAFIVLGAIFLFPIGFFAIAGGIFGMQDFDAKQKKTMEEELAKKGQQSSDSNIKNLSDTTKDSVKTIKTINNTKYPTFSAYLETHPVDYDTKPTIAPIFDPSNAENLLLENSEGIKMEFQQLHIQIINDEIYLLTKEIGNSEEDDSGLLVFKVDYENDEFNFCDDEEIFDIMVDGYAEMIVDKVVEEEEETTSKTRYGTKSTNEKITLDLYDTSIDEKTWKKFRKTASQEDLSTIAIGAKYRMSGVSRIIIDSVCLVAMILAFALMFATNFISLIAYPIAAFFATKSIRYFDTYSKSYKKLSKENKAFVDSYFNDSIAVTMTYYILNLILYFITFPYQMLMIGIGFFAPNFVIAKNGILVSIPKGYDVGNLGAIGEYYSSINLLEDLEIQEESKKTYYSYTNEYGCEQTVFTKNGIDFFSENGEYVGKKGNDGKVYKQ